MSLSRQTNNMLSRPAAKYIKFSGAEDDGLFSYFEKFAKDDDRYSEDNKGQNVKIDIDGAFVMDCDLATVTGFEKRRGFLYSNEVRDPQSDIMVVRFHSQKDPVAKGNWETVKSEMGDRAKFTKSIYLWLNGEIVNLHISGAGLTSWFNDIEGSRKALGERTIKVKSIEHGQNGNVKYCYPVFEFGDPVDEETFKEAYAADEEILQPYLDEYFKRQGTSSDKPDESKEPESTEDEVRNTDNWREFSTNDGVKLGTIPHEKLYDMKIALEGYGDEDSEQYDMVCRGIKEYEEAVKTWKSRKDKKGRSLEEYSFEELNSTLEAVTKKDPMNAYRFYLEAAIEDQEDDIPF